MCWRCFVGRGSGHAWWMLGARSEGTCVHAPKDLPLHMRAFWPSGGCFGGPGLAASERWAGEALTAHRRTGLALSRGLRLKGIRWLQAVETARWRLVAAEQLTGPQ